MGGIDHGFCGHSKRTQGRQCPAPVALRVRFQCRTIRLGKRLRHAINHGGGLDDRWFRHACSPAKGAVGDSVARPSSAIWLMMTGGRKHCSCASAEACLKVPTFRPPRLCQEHRMDWRRQRLSGARHQRQWQNQRYFRNVRQCDAGRPYIPRRSCGRSGGRHENGREEHLSAVPMPVENATKRLIVIKMQC